MKRSTLQGPDFGPATGVKHAAAAIMLCAVGAVARGNCLPEWTPGVGFDEQGMIQAIATLEASESVTHYVGWSGGVARWTGSEWMPLGGGDLLEVKALAVFDAGDGLELYAAPLSGSLPIGHPKGIVRWDGTQWHHLGAGLAGAGTANTLAVYDDGSGPALYVGGKFTSAGGVPAANLARWNGSEWSAVGDAPGGLSSNGVRSMAVFDDGDGAALYVGGNNLSVEGVATHVARWDGTSWTPLPGGPQAHNTIVLAMTEFDDGSGPALYLAGQSSPDPSLLPIVTRYDGDSWSIVGPAFNGSIHALAAFDDGSGSGASLYVGGVFTLAYADGGETPLSRLARWDDQQWQQVGGGVNSGVMVLAPSVDLLQEQDPALLVGGMFATAGGVPSRLLAQWQGCSALLGDLNGDGCVDQADLGLLLAAYGVDGGGDINGDGATDQADLGILLSNWGVGC